MRSVGGCHPTDVYDLKVRAYEPRDDGQDLPRVCRGASRARAGSRWRQRERLCGRAGRLAVRDGRSLWGDQSRACRSRGRSDARVCPGRRVGAGACRAWLPRTFVHTARCRRHTVFRVMIRLDRRRFRMRCTWLPCRRIALWTPAGVRWRCSRTWPIRVRANCCPMWRAAPYSAAPPCRARV